MTYKEFKDFLIDGHEYFIMENLHSIYVIHKFANHWCIRISKIDINDYEFMNYSNCNGESNKELVDSELRQAASELINTPLSERGGIKAIIAYEDNLS